MEIAQDKLSVTRELAEVSQNYQNALNQTTLVWDFDGSGQNMFNLSYDVLMTPTTLNNFTPYLITNRAGAVVLNGQMAKAAKKISTDGDPSTPSEAGFAAFMKELGKAGVVPESVAQDIRFVTDYHYAYNTVNDEGKTVKVPIEETNLTPEQIAAQNAYLDTDFVNGYNKKAGCGAEPLNKNGACADNVLGLAYKLEHLDLGIITDYLKDCDAIYVNGAKANDSLKGKLTLDQILTNEVVVVQTYPDGDHNYHGIAGLGLNEDDTSGLYLTLVDALKEQLVTDAVTAEAFMAADIATRDQYRDYKELSGKKESESNVINSLKTTSDEYNQIIYYENEKDNFNSGAGLT